MRNSREGGIRTDKADDWGVAAVIALGVRFPLPFDARLGAAVSKQDYLQAYDSSENVSSCLGIRSAGLFFR